MKKLFNIGTGGQTMRIIDADKFKKQIAGMAIVNGYSAQKVNKMCELIDEQPTAYDVDKVIEQLNNIKKYNLNLADIMLDIQANGINRHFVCLEDAIEIVKAGGNS